MKLEHIRKHSRFYVPVLILDKIISHRKRKILSSFFFYLTIILLFLSLGIINTVTERIIGATLLSGSIWAILFALEAFFYSYVFSSRTDALEGIDNHNPITYELSKVVKESDPKRITQSFLSSDIGIEVMKRLSVSEELIEDFFANRKSPLTEKDFEIKGNDITIESFLNGILDCDKEFDQFLMSVNISHKDIIGAANWVERIYNKEIITERWWGVDRLARLKGIGKKWSYGNTNLIDTYGLDISAKYDLNTTFLSFDLYSDEIDSLEAILARNYEANALLVSEYGVPKAEVVAGLARRISDGSVLGPLEHKRIVDIDMEAFISENSTKDRFENEFIKVLNEAVLAGNVILLFDDLPATITSVKAMGGDFGSLIDDYIAGSSLQVIAMSDNGGYEKIIRPNDKLMTRFEPVLVRGADSFMLGRLLQDKVIDVEKGTGLYFTYQSIRAMISTVERYFIEGTLEDKVGDFLSEITPRMIQEGNGVVTEENVYEMVTEKTGVPVGEVNASERGLLASLEEVLAKRVVGQREAISAISNSMRRNRSGIGNPNRPVGSFLFLGPTGVGKTETSKALAEAVFGDSKRLMRLDMSEYNTGDAINRLIGTVTGEVGVLTSMIRENPHGVLLLDEFEKTDDAVLNLFLQIFDEGVFSDAKGKKINARNIMFIATSNAGSDMIWNYTKGGNNSLSSHKSEIVDTIVTRKIFRPELINRFDGVILFSPLSTEDLKMIARLMLNKLKERVREKGINFIISDKAIDLLVSEGSDPQFGARPLNRAIQDKIEADVAEKIISGALKAGMSYEYGEL